MKQTITNLWQENGTLSMIIQINKTNYDVVNEITYNTEFLKSSPCDYNNVYILVRDDIIKCITKSDETTTNDDEDLDLVIQCTIINVQSDRT